MKQLEAIEIIAEAIKEDHSIRAIFLKGSIAKDNLDEYADVDMYCIVKEDEQEAFLKRRLEILEKYRPLIYWSESNFVGPQIVGVFDNGLHFDLYTVTLETLQNTDKIKVIYDPFGLLDHYEPAPLSLSEESIIEFFHEFIFSLLEFDAAYNRNDLIWASRLASHLSGNLSVILRYLYDEDNARLGFKRLHKHLEKEVEVKMTKAMDLSGPSYLPGGVKLLIEIASDVLKKLPVEVSSKINTTFFNYMAEKVNNL